MYNLLNVLFHYNLMLIQLIYVQNQKYLIDFDVQQVTKRKIFIIFYEEFYN